MPGGGWCSCKPVRKLVQSCGTSRRGSAAWVHVNFTCLRRRERGPVLYDIWCVEWCPPELRSFFQLIVTVRKHGLVNQPVPQRGDERRSGVGSRGQFAGKRIEGCPGSSSVTSSPRCATMRSAAASISAEFHGPGINAVRSLLSFHGALRIPEVRVSVDVGKNAKKRPTSRCVPTGAAHTSGTRSLECTEVASCNAASSVICTSVWNSFHRCGVLRSDA